MHANQNYEKTVDILSLACQKKEKTTSSAVSSFSEILI